MAISFRNLIVSSLIGLVGFLTVLFTTYPLAAQEDAASFYAGKRLTLYVGYAPGGGFDINARLVGRHLRAFIPGNPRIIVKNKPGAGGMVLANYLYNIADADGLEIGTVGRTGPLSELLGRADLEYILTRRNSRGLAARVQPSLLFSFARTWESRPSRT